MIRNNSVSVSVNQVTYLDLSTGLEYNLTDQWKANGCVTTLFTSNVSYLSNSCKAPGLNYSAASTICSGS